MRRIAAWLLCMLAFPAFEAGAQEAPLPEEVSRTIDLLGAGDLAVREEAFQRLLGWGAENPEEVLDRLREDPADPEQRRLIEELRRKVRVHGIRRRLERMAADGSPLKSEIEKLLADFSVTGFRWFLKATRRHPAEGAVVAALFLEHEGPGVRRLAVIALGDFGDAAFAERVAPFLGDPEGETRRAAIRALGKMKAAVFAPRILPFLEDRDPALRQAAVEAVGNMGDPKLACRIAQVLDDPEAPQLEVRKSDPEDLALRVAAAEALRVLVGGKWPADARGVDVARAWWRRHREACDPAACPYGCPAPAR